MRFGIYAEMQTPLDKPHAELTWEIMRQIEHADAVGFDTYSVIEHHFFQQFGISANPLAMFTARMPLGTCGASAPGARGGGLRRLKLT